MIGQTTGANPWGELVGHNEALAALNNSSKETLMNLVHHSNSGITHQQLEAMSTPDLVSKLNVDELHIREKGPIAFGGYFYGITGFHGFHVFSGVIINIVMLVMTQKNVFQNRGHYLMIEKAGLYWHFVDLVWVFVFLCFYLI
jgi:cytochrome c oxidase subunit III